MPLKLSSHRLEAPEARIEIIPLIDIMFFLLAAFMLVSLSMVRLQSIPVNLPGANTASADAARNLITVSVDLKGALFVERTPMGGNELTLWLSGQRRTNAALRVLIRGDQSARHGDVIRALDLVRAAGIEKVAFETRNRSTSEATPP